MFGSNFGLPRGDISLPLYPGVGLSAANIPLFFESTKFVKQILQNLLQNKSNKANWTNWINWTPDARGWTPGGPERQDGAEVQDGQRPEGKESGFRSLESIWTEDGGSGGHGRGATGRLEAYRTATSAYRIASISSPTR